MASGTKNHDQNSKKHGRVPSSFSDAIKRFKQEHGYCVSYSTPASSNYKGSHTIQHISQEGLFPMMDLNQQELYYGQHLDDNAKLVLPVSGGNNSSASYSGVPNPEKPKNLITDQYQEFAPTTQFHNNFHQQNSSYFSTSPYGTYQSPYIFSQSINPPYGPLNPPKSLHSPALGAGKPVHAGPFAVPSYAITGGALQQQQQSMHHKGFEIMVNSSTSYQGTATSYSHNGSTLNSTFLNHMYLKGYQDGLKASLLKKGLAPPQVDFPAATTTSVPSTSYAEDPINVHDDTISEENSFPPGNPGLNNEATMEVALHEELEMFKTFDIVKDHSDHHFSSAYMNPPSKSWVKKVQEEWKILQENLPDTICVRVYETRMDLLRAAIVGAHGTPYQDGIFFFDFHFPAEYPNVPPGVYFHSHGLQLNPNLYSNGYVCLSLINTWGGDPSEMWRPGYSTILQVLVSIQALVLNSEPYYNEPGFEYQRGNTNIGSILYSHEAFLSTLKLMIYTMHSPPKDFKDFVYGHFLKRSDEILKKCVPYFNGLHVAVTSYYMKYFQSSLQSQMKMLVQAFANIGVANCDKYLLR